MYFTLVLTAQSGAREVGEQGQESIQVSITEEHGSQLPNSSAGKISGKTPLNVQNVHCLLRRSCFEGM